MLIFDPITLILKKYSSKALKTLVTFATQSCLFFSDQKSISVLFLSQNKITNMYSNSVVPNLINSLLKSIMLV